MFLSGSEFGDTELSVGQILIEAIRSGGPGPTEPGAPLTRAAAGVLWVHPGWQKSTQPVLTAHLGEEEKRKTKSKKTCVEIKSLQ